MVDFSKLPKPSTTRTVIRYRCQKCEVEEDYTIELPSHMRVCDPPAKRCGGMLVEVSRQEAKR